MNAQTLLMNCVPSITYTPRVPHFYRPTQPDVAAGLRPKAKVVGLPGCREDLENTVGFIQATGLVI